MRRLLPWIVLGVLVVGIVAMLAWPDGSPTRSERIHALESQLKCPECQGLSVRDSNAPTSRAIRRDIRAQVAAGVDDDEIRQSFVDRYGESILLEPQSSGIGLIAWGLPVVVLALGAVGVVFALLRGRDRPRLEPTAADEALVARTREQEHDA